MKNQIIDAVAISAILLAVMFSWGCGTEFFSAKTVAIYEITPDGIRRISYESTKEQQGLALDLIEENGKIKSVRIRADKSTTNDESVTAAMNLHLKILDLLQTLTVLVEKAAMTGGS